ncbi:MAG TPA: cytochrome c maturation protein CcmE [Vicinamibacterales bacterium]|jgi:cytochrome c-type biogenesis protein CcmE
MSSKPVKIGATVVILGLAFAGLMYSTLSEGTEYYKHVDEVMSNPDAWHGKRLQLHGFVVDHSILRKPDTLDYRFQVQNNGKVVPVRYSGVVPDTFKGGAEVVLKGRLDSTGFTVDANGVMAKCPSKYEAKSTAAASGG